MGKTSLARRRPADDATPGASLAHYDARAIRLIFNQIEGDLGGRPALVAHLLTAPDDPKTAHLLGLLADPTSDTIPLSQLLRAGGVTLPQLLQTLAQAGFARAFLRSIQVIADKAPAVVRDVMDRGAPHTLTCQPCEGTGVVEIAAGGPDLPPTSTKCPTCLGKGCTLVLPTTKQQELALDLARLLPTKATLVQNFDQRAAGSSGTLEGMAALIKATDDLLAHARPAPRAPQTQIIDAAPALVATDAADVDSGP